MYGQSNTGPRAEMWRPGDRVRHLGDGAVGTVRMPRERTSADQVGKTWVVWDDGQATFADPGDLDIE